MMGDFSFAILLLGISFIAVAAFCLMILLTRWK